MIEQVNESDFVQRFVLIDRKEHFSYEGRKALFQYFEEFEEDSDQQIEFDCIAICCEYSEFENIEEYLKDYSHAHSTLEEVKNLNETKDFDEVIEEEIMDKTVLIKIGDTLNDGFIIQQF